MNPPPHINNRNTSDISDISDISQAPMSSQYYLEHIETSRNIMNNITIKSRELIGILKNTLINIFC